MKRSVSVNKTVYKSRFYKPEICYNKDHDLERTFYFMKKGTIPLLAILFTVIVLGGTAMLGASSERSFNYELYSREGSLGASSGLMNIEDRGSWTKSLDRVIPPEERKRIIESGDVSELNTTERFFRELMDEFSENGTLESEDILERIDSESYEVFMNNFVEREKAFINSKVETFDRESLSTLEGLDRGSIAEYGNLMGEIMLQNSEDLDHELELFSKMVSVGDRQAEIDLIKISNGYRMIAEESFNVSVPEEIASLHFDIANYMKRNSFYLENMANFHKNPLLATISINLYLENCTYILEALVDIADFFENKGVVYNEYDKGMAFVFMGYVNGPEDLIETFFNR